MESRNPSCRIACGNAFSSALRGFGCDASNETGRLR
jgi:hypothetical protein